MDPGWYDDPLEFGWLRYWDGSAWTRDTAPRPADFRPPTPQRVDPELASFWARLGAFIIDWLIIILPIELVVVGIWMTLNVDLVNGLAERMAAGDTAALGNLIEAETGPIMIVSLLSGPAWFCYEYFMLRARSATAGMLLLGIRVVPDGGDPGAKLPRRSLFLRATVFGLVQLLAAVPIAGTVVNLVFLVGCLAMLFDPRGRAWHDRLAHTRVIRQTRNSRDTPAG